MRLFKVLVCVGCCLASTEVIPFAKENTNHSSASVAVKSRAPECQDVIQYALNQLFTTLISELRFAENVRSKKIAAGIYYGTIFNVWFGSRRNGVGGILDLEVEEYARAYKRWARELAFEDMIDRDDPLGWNKLSPDVERSTMIEVFGGPSYAKWVLESTKDQLSYRDAVVRFREFLNSVEN